MILTISSVSIRQDDNGRYCLNDLHKAAGNEKRHRPNYWLELQGTKDLVDYLDSEKPIADITAIFTKQGLGTFVVKELVYAYAMWISAKFHITVIRAYDSMVNQKPYGLKELPPAYLNHDMKRHVQELVNAKKIIEGKSHNTIYHDLKTHFQTSNYSEIPIVKYAEVCAWFGATPKYDMPQMVSIDVRELESMRALSKPTPALSGELLDNENILVVRTRTKQIMTAEEYLEMMTCVHHDNPNAPFALIKKEPLLELKKLLSKII